MFGGNLENEGVANHQSDVSWTKNTSFVLSLYARTGQKTPGFSFLFFICVMLDPLMRNT